MAQPGSPDDEGVGPYGLRYIDDRQRIGDRLSAVERTLAIQARELETLRADHNKLYGELGKHLDHTIEEARRASESQGKMVDNLQEMRADIRVLREHRGTVSIAVVAQVAGIIGVLTGVLVALFKITGA